MSLDALGCTRDTMGSTTGRNVARRSKSFKTILNSDWGLQLDPMKPESLVIADQHAAVNTFPSLVLTARQLKGVGSARSPTHVGRR
jgi:hypothetical protein